MIIIKTAELIRDYIEDLVPKNWKVQRSYLPVADVETLEREQCPLVFVSVADREAERATQGGSRKNTLTVDIAINKKLTETGKDLHLVNSEIDELVNTSECIYNSFIKKVKIGDDKFRITADQPEHIFVADYESIADENCFLGVIRIIAEVYEIITSDNIRK